jgi:aromatic ring-opening dioxygenase catalytic subunit (LigB family)
MRALRSVFSGTGKVNNGPFDKALEDAVTSPSEQERNEKLSNWEKMPGAKDAHPEGGAEHLVPLFVVAGAGGEQPGKRVLTWNSMMGSLASYMWE